MELQRRIFALSEDGDTFVIQAGPDFKLLGKNSLDEMSMATPAVAGGSPDRSDREHALPLHAALDLTAF